MPMRVVFMGTPAFAVPALQALIANKNCEVVAVYTQPPRPKGRGGVIQKSPVHVCADEHHISVLTPLSFKKDATAVEAFRNLNADMAIVAAYGLILPQTVLDAPRLGCINIHGSLLPHWRGASPVQHAILHGDVQTGITLMQMEAGLDTGPMIAHESTPLFPTDTTDILMMRLAHIGARMIDHFINDVAAGKDIHAVSQNDTLSTYAPMIKKEQGLVDWNDRAEIIERKIRAFDPWPGTFTFGPKGKIKILSAQIASTHHHGPNGLVLSQDGIITCGLGTTLKLDRVQPENAKAMDVKAAMNGGYLAVGQVLRDTL